MQRLTLVLLGLILVAPVVAAGQSSTPRILNGRVETRTGSAIDREISAASAPASTEPVWVAWRAPMIRGDRDMCGWYVDQQYAIRGAFLNDDLRGLNADPRASPLNTPPSGPVPLEAGTNVIVLARIIGGQVERLRTVGDDCPMDAGGRTVYWLSTVTSAESVRYLASLTRPAEADRSMADPERTVVSSAVRAIAYHADPAADATLDQIAASHTDSGVRRQAARVLADYRGAHGVATLVRLLGTERDVEMRRSLVTSLGASRDASAMEALRPYLKDADARVRAEAAYAFVQRGGAAVLPEALRIISSDADDTVRRRVVSSIGRLPGDAGVPTLIQLVRTSTNDVVRKEAVTALSQSKDPRAMALIEEILKK